MASDIDLILEQARRLSETAESLAPKPTREARAQAAPYGSRIPSATPAVQELREAQEILTGPQTLGTGMAVRDAGRGALDFAVRLGNEPFRLLEIGANLANVSRAREEGFGANFEAARAVRERDPLSNAPREFFEEIKFPFPGAAGVAADVANPLDPFGPVGNVLGLLVPAAIARRALPSTRVTDEAGNPLRMYHGTARTFEDVSPVAIEAYGKNYYGPGFYLTDDPRIASSYATPRSQGASPTGELAPQVRTQYVNLENPMDLREPAGFGFRSLVIEEGKNYGEDFEMFLRDELEMLFRTTPEDATRQQLFEAGRKALRWMSREGLTDSSAQQEFADALNDSFRARGYDGIIHTGGSVTGGKPHTVAIAFRPDQVIGGQQGYETLAQRAVQGDVSDLTPEEVDYLMQFLPNE